MPNNSWANPDQLKFLADRRPAFSNAQTAKTLPKFWTEINRDFFVLWPDQASEAYSEDIDAPVKKKRRKNTSSHSTPRVLEFNEWVETRKKVFKSINLKFTSFN
jgi:hypothetical protein